MPIHLEPCPSDECDLTEWSITDADRDTLVSALAYLYLFQERNALAVIEALEPTRRPPRGRVAENVIDKLTAPNNELLALMQTGTPDERTSASKRAAKQIEHRDGLLFQYLSWIAARLTMPQGHLTAPHVRSADKGFDGFIIEMDEEDGTLERIVLCEDKASTAPRGLVTSSVWKEIQSIRRGERDDEILADLTALVRQVAGADEDRAEAIVDAALWEESRHFRVSVATGEDIRREAGFGHLLKDFKDVAPGARETRTGGVLAFPDVRQGMSALADEISARVRSITEEAAITHV